MSDKTVALRNVATGSRRVFSEVKRLKLSAHQQFELKGKNKHPSDYTKIPLLLMLLRFTDAG